MMKCKQLADKFTEKIYVDTVSEEILAWHMLRRPSVNHSDIFTPMVERFVFDFDELRPSWDYLCEFDEAGKQRLCVAGENLRVPFDNCWLEVASTSRSYGYLVSACGNDHEIRSFTEVDGEPRFTWAAKASTLRQRGPLSVTRLLPKPLPPDLTLQLITQASAFEMLCAILASPNMATTERVVRAMGTTKESRALHRARAQRGKPVFSFNRVSVRLPQAAHLNGVLVDRDSPLVKRAHMVIGHWRLIDGVLEPYWVWVHPHERGDRTAGFVANERYVSLSAAVLRRGWLIPQTAGTAGQRVPAVKAA
jgi:hypothetical protein